MSITLNDDLAHYAFTGCTVILFSLWNHLLAEKLFVLYGSLTYRDQYPPGRRTPEVFAFDHSQ